MTRLSPWLLALGLLGCGRAASTPAPEGHAQPATKVLTYPRLEAYKSLDPARQLDAASNELVRNLYDRLLDYDYLARPYRLEPNLLTKLPELSADGLRYQLELRKDARFQDDPCFPGGKGRPVTADDVVYSFKRFADANTNPLSYSLWQGAVRGMDEFRARSAQLGPGADLDQLEISGVTRQDAQHLTIELTRPSPIALLPLATTPLSIVPREAVQRYGDEFQQHPVGSGPFSLAQNARRGVIVLRRNPHYHLSYPTRGASGDAEAGLLRSAGQRLPLLDEVRLPLIEEAQPRMLQFRSGQLDWVAFDRDNFRNMTLVDARGVQLKPELASQYRMYAEPDLRVDGWRFNFADPLLGKNRALRQAIAYALDTAAFVARMYDGRGVPLQGLVPLPIPGSERDVPARGYPHSAERARAKLAEAGYPGGRGLPALSVEYRSATSLARSHFEFQRAQLAAFGITLEANFQSFTAYMKKLEAGSFQIIDFSWSADYPDAENFYQMLYSANRAPGSNYGNYSNPEYDRAFEHSRFMPNGPARYALFARMNQLIDEDAPVALLWNLTRTGLIQRRVRNFKYHALLEVPFAYLSVE